MLRGTVLLTGHARLPEGKPGPETFSLALVVDPGTHTILDTECSCHLALSQEFLRRCLVGQSVLENVEETASDLESRLYIPAARAVVRAFLNAHNRYREFAAMRVSTGSVTATRTIGPSVVHS